MVGQHYQSTVFYGFSRAEAEAAFIEQLNTTHHLKNYI